MIPFLLSVALLLAALYIPPLLRNVVALSAYVTFVVAVSICLHLVWFGGNP